jgi:hypothetical protein
MSVKKNLEEIWEKSYTEETFTANYTLFDFGKPYLVLHYIERDATRDTVRYCNIFLTDEIIEEMLNAVKLHRRRRSYGTRY